jgi:hypothetical protein
MGPGFRQDDEETYFLLRAELTREIARTGPGSRSLLDGAEPVIGPRVRADPLAPQGARLSGTTR